MLVVKNPVLRALVHGRRCSEGTALPCAEFWAVDPAMSPHRFKELVEVDRISGFFERFDNLRRGKDVAELHHLYLLLVAGGIPNGHAGKISAG